MSKLEQVNSTDVAEAIRLGCRTMQSIFNADDNDFPFFGSSLLPTAELTFVEDSYPGAREVVRKYVGF